MLERFKEIIVGTFHKEKNYGIVIADDARAYFNIMIPKGKINGAKEEDKVVVEIERFSEGQKKPQGRIIQVIGNKNEMGTDILSIIYQHELPIEFPGAVLKEVQNIDQKVHPGSLKKRTDFSELFYRIFYILLNLFKIKKTGFDFTQPNPFKYFCFLNKNQNNSFFC